jgi:lipoate-protein ligase A
VTGPSQLRVIRDGARSGPFNMACDAALLKEHRTADPPVLRLYRWSPPALTYGYHQRPQLFAGGALAASGYDLVRRPTGGRAILHVDELTYAVIGASPSPLFGDSLHASYETINRALLRFLARLGLSGEISAGEPRAAQRGPVCFQSAGQYEIRSGGRKLIGSAQRRTAGRFLQHGSILTGPGHARLVEFLPPPAPAPDELLAATTNLGELLGCTLAGEDWPWLEDAFVAACAEAWQLVPVEGG